MGITTRGKSIDSFAMPSVSAQTTLPGDLPEFNGDWTPLTRKENCHSVTVDHSRNRYGCIWCTMKTMLLALAGYVERCCSGFRPGGHYEAGIPYKACRGQQREA